MDTFRNSSVEVERLDVASDVNGFLAGVDGDLKCSVDSKVVRPEYIKGADLG